MYFYGIDPASNTGVVILDQAGKLVRAQMVASQRKGPAKLMDLRDGVKALIETFTPRLLALENYAFGSKWGREQAGEIGGTIRLLLYEHSITPILVAPDTLKLFVTGNGHAAKEDMKLAVFKRWGVDFEGKKNDLADAYGLARMAYLLGTGRTDGLEDYQLRALRTVQEGAKK